MASEAEQAIDRRERLRKLAMETIDLAKDPYILRCVLQSHFLISLPLWEGRTS